MCVCVCVCAREYIYEQMRVSGCMAECKSECVGGWVGVGD